MDNTEPYPGSHLPQQQSSSPPGKRKPTKRFWLRHLIIAGFLFCAWTALGLPFALGNTRMDMIIDAVGWLICCLYLAFALVAGLITGLAALVRRMLTSLHSPRRYAMIEPTRNRLLLSRLRTLVRLKPLGRSSRERLLLRVALYGGALFIGLPLAFSFVMTRTHRTPVSTDPPLGYAEVQLVSDELKLRAWLSRGELGRPAFVIVHGLGDNLESYQGHARPFIERGHTVLLPDLRGHGGSEGKHTTMGGQESEDVRSAMAYLRTKGLADGGIVLMGHSMGSVAVLLAAVDQSDVRAIIVEAPYDTYRNTIAHHARVLYGLPSWVPIIPLSIKAAEWRAGFDADAIDAVAAARRIQVPLLAIVDGKDERMPEPVVRRIVDAHPGPNTLWVAQGADHVGAIFDPAWKEVVLGFLDENGV